MTEGSSNTDDGSPDEGATVSSSNSIDKSTDEHSGYPLNDERMAGVAEIHIAEYKVLRKEIDLYHKQQKRIMNFMIIILTTLIGVLGSNLISSTSAFKQISFVFLLFPFIFTLLAMLYSDRTIRIIRIADYIHNYLRRNVEQVSGEKVWQWEVYKSHTDIFDRRVALLLDRSRWIVFVLPSLLAVGAYILIDSNPWQPIEIAIYIFDTLFIGISIATMFLTEETTGIDVRASMDLAAKEREDLRNAIDDDR